MAFSTVQRAGPTVSAGQRAPERNPVRTLTYPKRDAFLWILAVLVALYVWRMQGFNPVVAKLKPAVVTMAIAMALWIRSNDPVRRLNLIKGPILTTVLWLLALMFLGIPTSLVAGKSLTFWVLDVLPNFLLLIVVACGIRNMRDFEWLALVSLLGGAIFALDRLTVGTLGFYDRNDLAMVLLMHIPFAVYFLRPGVQFMRRLLGAVSLGLMIVVIVDGQSRGGFLGLLLVGSYILLRYRGIPARTRLLSVIIGVVIVIVVGSDMFWQRMSTLLNPQADYNWSGQSKTGRVEVWKRGVGYMLENPLLGVGLRNFPQAEGRSKLSTSLQLYGSGFKWSVAHNSFVELGAEVGMIGLALFIAIFFLSFRLLIRIGRGGPPTTAGPPELLPAAQMLMASLIGFMFCGFLISAEHFSVLYVIIGMVLALAKIHVLSSVRHPVPGLQAPRSAFARVPANAVPRVQGRR
ncbi:MAG: O-antigen ligase family protein [Anaerolineae bacterium]|nr:O-antigen ligase family protein [Gemmatimonadaceae bacterium]